MGANECGEPAERKNVLIDGFVHSIVFADGFLEIEAANVCVILQRAIAEGSSKWSQSGA